MSREQIDSSAFSHAELQSERLRILGVIGFFTVVVAITLIRTFIVRTAVITNRSAWTFLLVGLIVAYEIWTLRRVDLALQTKLRLPARFWIVSTILETSIPALAIAFLTSDQIQASYRALANPLILVFFIFIILSTLRLSPWLAALSGIVASASYLCAALYLGWRPPLPGTPAPMTQAGVSLNAITLLFGGIVAAAVAGQIRRHVGAALREAETKRRLEAVEHDLQIARSIQQSLLPQDSPRVAGFEIAGWNQPADDTGGDYFDWKVFPDGKVVVSLADVTGHGIGPALLASVCRAYARSSFSSEGDLPRALEKINHELGADLSVGRFVTFAAAICCPNCPDVELLSAGHGPIFIYNRPQDQFSEMGAQGLPFGILPVFQSDPPVHLQLEAGDLVILATDGFFEWENDQGEQFGIKRMEEAIRASRDAGARDIIANLYQHVAAFSNGSKQQDDLTAVVIKRT